MSSFTKETEALIHQRQRGACACCKKSIEPGEPAEYREVLPEKTAGAGFARTHENGVLAHSSCVKEAEREGASRKASDRYPYTHNNPAWIPRAENESKDHAHWCNRIDRRESRARFQADGGVDEFRKNVREEKRELRAAYEAEKDNPAAHQRYADAVLRVDDRALHAYLGKSKFSLEELTGDGRKERLASISEQMKPGDRWVKVIAADPKHAGPPSHAGGYVCLASQLDGLNSGQMGGRLGVDDARLKTNGAWVVEFQQTICPGDLQYKGTTRHPAGEPSCHPKYPPASGGAVHQAVLDSPYAVDQQKSTFLKPGECYGANVKMEMSPGPKRLCSK